MRIRSRYYSGEQVREVSHADLIAMGVENFYSDAGQIEAMQAKIDKLTEIVGRLIESLDLSDVKVLELSGITSLEIVV